MALTGYFQSRGMGLISQSSSSGGGLPGRPGLERVSGRSLFLRKNFWNRRARNKVAGFGA
jgi:hypothetical protein